MPRSTSPSGPSIALPLALLIIAGEIDISVAAIIALASVAMGLAAAHGVGTAGPRRHRPRHGSRRRLHQRRAGDRRARAVHRRHHRHHDAVSRRGVCGARRSRAQGLSGVVRRIRPGLSRRAGVDRAGDVRRASQYRSACSCIARAGAARSTRSARIRWRAASPAFRSIAIDSRCSRSPGLFSGLAAVLLTSRLGSTRPSIAQGWELEIISMVILGGVSVWGGKGSIAGVVLAALVFGLVTFGLGLMNMPGIVMSIFTGLLLMLVVAVPALVSAPAMSSRAAVDRAFSTSARPTRSSRSSIRRSARKSGACAAPTTIVRGAGGRELDVAAIEAWLLESLRIAPGARAHRGDRARSRTAPPRCSSITRAKCSPRRTTRTPRFDEVAAEYAAAARPLLADLLAAPAAGPQPRPPAVLSTAAARRAVPARRASAALSAVLVVAPVGGHGDARSRRSGRIPICGGRTSRRIRRSRASRAGRRSCRRMRSRDGPARDACARASPRRPASTRPAKSPAASTIRMPRTCGSSWIANARLSPWCRAGPGPS